MSLVWTKAKKYLSWEVSRSPSSLTKLLNIQGDPATLKKKFIFATSLPDFILVVNTRSFWSDPDPVSTPPFPAEDHSVRLGGVILIPVASQSGANCL